MKTGMTAGGVRCPQGPCPASRGRHRRHASVTTSHTISLDTLGLQADRPLDAWCLPVVSFNSTLPRAQSIIKAPLTIARAPRPNAWMLLSIWWHRRSLVYSQNANKNVIFSKTKQCRATVSTGNLYEVLHDLFKEPIIGSIKFKMAENRHCENRQITIPQQKMVFFGWNLVHKFEK